MKAEQEAKVKADQAAEAKQKAEAEAKQKAEADKQAEADQKAAAEQAAKAEAAKEAEATKEAEAAKEAEAQAAAAQKQKDDDAKASKSKAEEAPASPSKDPALALSTSSASSLSAKQKRKDMMKRAEEKDTAAGYEDPFQPKQAAAAQTSAPAAGPQPVKTQAESSGRYASCHAQLASDSVTWDFCSCDASPACELHLIPTYNHTGDAGCRLKTAGSVVQSEQP